jgi:hypothetical protein
MQILLLQGAYDRQLIGPLQLFVGRGSVSPADEITSIPLSNRVTVRLGIEQLILLPPIDLVATGRLASAVSQAGGGRPAG